MGHDSASDHVGVPAPNDIPRSQRLITTEDDLTAVGPSASEQQSLIAALDAVRAGDSERYAEVVVICQQRVRSYLAARCRSISEVEELVQATFVSAYEDFAKWTGNGSFQAWLRGIAHNHLRHHRRSWKRLRTVPIDYLDASFVATEDLHQDTLIPRLRRCLEHLPERGRKLLAQRYGEGQTLADLARLHEIARNVLANRLLRWRQMLRQCIEGQR